MVVLRLPPSRRPSPSRLTVFSSRLFPPLDSFCRAACFARVSVCVPSPAPAPRRRFAGLPLENIPLAHNDGDHFTTWLARGGGGPFYKPKRLSAIACFLPARPRAAPAPRVCVCLCVCVCLGRPNEMG